MNNNLQTSHGQNNKTSYSGLLITVIIFLGATLPFHYIPSRFRVFPKEHLTFSNTLITQEDIDNLIARYNKSSFFEQQAVDQEPLVRKHMEKGIIVEKDR